MLQEQQDQRRLQTPLLWHRYPARFGFARCLQVFAGRTKVYIDRTTGICYNKPLPVINTVMKIQDITVVEAKASKKLCTSNKSDKELGASNLSSCKSQGYRKRVSQVKHTIKHKRRSIDGKKIKGKKYGGPLPDWS